MSAGGGGGSYGGASMFRVAPPTLSGIKLPKPTAGIRDFLSQGQMVPQLQRMLGSANLADAALMEAVAPGLLGTTRAYGQTAQSMAQGLIPDDVQNATMRNTAFQALNTGIGMDSSAGRNMMARDLGMTSLQMQEGSRGFMDAAMKSSAFLAPNRMSAGLMSAESYQKRRDEAAAIQAQIDSQNAMMQFMFQNSKKKK
jgi:hypothetical protein